MTKSKRRKNRLSPDLPYALLTLRPFRPAGWSHAGTSLPNCWRDWVIGNFDGLHGRHRVILQHALDLAAGTGSGACNSHLSLIPESVLKRLSPVFSPSARCEKKRPYCKGLRVEGGVELVVLQKNFASLSARNVCGRNVLIILSASHVVVGYDFSFRQKGEEGSPCLSCRCRSRCRFLVLQSCQKWTLPGRSGSVPSSAIRTHLENADMRFCQQ